ncbi:acetolactate synthase, large subunit [Desulfonispora thiosulfatigenes DSM 11270]|uniref:Acetolactate synthase n=1 Tax=Desulfonispora thiosulfatigenes DSM 11270 TaxID=656914 RepID=A0A1W1VF76_DESTI|nr:biosynthetic-type acetolactate synthase large subunit [Desulfonispora thiosulfatigenes]SMB91721.1 acetolactate synthase, large subunit [Desulfonispora thiosulfatigenes DSM 11270]
MLGSELLLKCLEEQGVDDVFGIPGGVLLPLYNVLRTSNINHILTRHEQGAIHAADGYSRSSNKVGVCFATSGPGATNLLTGLATAHMDSIPLIAITGQVGKSFLGKDSFQEADTTGFSQPVTKHNYLVTDARDIPSIVKEAFYIAKTGRPGPVLIDIPKDVFTQELTNIPEGKIRERVIKKLAKPEINDCQIQRVVEALKNAQNPLIFIGGGVTSDASPALEKIATKHQIPVACTLMAKGLFPPNSPLYLGMVGMHGMPGANYAIQNCDLLLAVGLRFDDRVTGDLNHFAKGAKVIHVDLDGAEIGKNRNVEIPVVADSSDFFNSLEKSLKKVKSTKDWLSLIEEKSCKLYNKNNDLISPQELLGKINDLVDDDTIIVTDVGQHQMWSALFVHPTKPKSFLTSGGLGTMGYGLPAAIGAQVANPKKKVVLITGDGSFQMNLQELAVIKQCKLPIKIFIVNNGCLGMVRQWQELFFDKNYAQSSLEFSPDWEILASSYGILGQKITNNEKKDKVIKECIESDFPCLLDVKVDPEANVYPIVPAGCSIDEMWGRWNDEENISSLG